MLGHYSRDEQLFPLTTAVHKMTGLSAARFQLADRGLVKIGYFADLVLFDPQTVRCLQFLRPETTGGRH